jgi:hypothetical protein
MGASPPLLIIPKKAAMGRANLPSAEMIFGEDDLSIRK